MKIKNSKLKINGKFNHLKIQKKWNKRWEDAKIYQPDLDNAKNPYFVLYMFPYPSAEGLHVGHAFSGTGADVYARFKRMKGLDVFHPMGFDAFGIHSENYALKINDHPKNLIDRATKHFREQFDSLGFSYDWSHSVNTSSPDYYKWTQWLFIQLFKAGLAEKKKALVNWCPSCKTVLADEQVLQKSKITRSASSGQENQKSKIGDEGTRDEERVGVCERCGTPVEMRELEQWFFKITKYADRLLEGLDRIDWTEKVKIAQRNWIGKKEGIRLRFVILSETKDLKKDKILHSVQNDKSAAPQNDKNVIEVFTTRPDTNFGATFIALAPEHNLSLKLTTPDNKSRVSEYIKNAKSKSDKERLGEGREKTGVFTGSYAINNLTQEKMPIWISDFVLMGFGTGAVVGVPGHDRRDFQFAKKFDLPIKRVVIGKDRDKSKITSIDQVQEEEGVMVNSDFLNGLEIHEAITKIMDYLEEKKYGKRQTAYHLRDWLISRQRYWGAPIPIIYCRKCWEIKNQKSKIKNEYGRDYINIEGVEHAIVSVPEDQLPVLLPYIENFRPLGTGASPLAQDKDFVNTTCPVCNGPAKRETDVCDTFLDSSWYFLRYPATDLANIPFPSKSWNSKFKIQNSKLTENLKLEIENSARRAVWLPVPMYIGGAEHSVLHLLYSRFITKVLFDLKFLNFDEPFTKFRAHGLLIKDGAKMSKSRGNVINPDEYIQRFGADTLRCYLMFLGPYEGGGDFRDSGIEGMERFLKRVRKLIESNLGKAMPAGRQENQSTKASANNSSNLKIEKSVNRAIKGVGNDVESLRYNTALAKIMELVNDLSASNHTLDSKYLKNLVILLAPFAPYLAEELWEMLRVAQVSRVSKGDKRTPRGTSDTRDTLDTSWSVHLQPWPSYDATKLEEENIKIAVQINGKLRAVLSIEYSVLSNKSEIEAQARKDQRVSKYIEGKKINKLIYVPGKILNFVI